LRRKVGLVLLVVTQNAQGHQLTVAEPPGEPEKVMRVCG
jgi:hypothetical protein